MEIYVTLAVGCDVKVLEVVELLSHYFTIQMKNMFATMINETV